MDPGPEAEWSELSTNLTLLFLGLARRAGAELLRRARRDRARQRACTSGRVAADFIVGFFLARIPILLFQAVQAALLPKLAGARGLGPASPTSAAGSGSSCSSSWGSACSAW